VLKQIKKWQKSEELKIEDAFRVMDADFDGMINKKDLKHFLLTSLKLESEAITESRVNRIFKLLD
jgi:Ca2+-binding EF-hand superfamily protein